MIGSLVRRLLAKRDYVLWKRQFLRFGIDPLLDVCRLSRLWGRPVELIFDVGANAGQFRHQAHGAFPGAVIHSFEPHPPSFVRLQQAAGSDAHLHQLALSDRSGALPFYVYGNSAEGSLMNSLTPDAGFARRGGMKPEVIEVESLTLDRLCERERIEGVDLLKVDTEGFDLAVLQGAEGMLSKGRVGFVYVEFNTLLSQPGVIGGALGPIAEFLAPFGLRYVCTYTDFIKTDGPLWVCANALFALDPNALAVV